MRRYSGFVAILAAGLLTGCQPPNASNNVYAPSALNAASRTVEGRIVSKRQVIVQGTGALGGTAGAVLGGVGGSAIGGSARANVAGAVAGAVAGGIAGAVIEESATRQQAFEYIVKSDVAGLMTIIQADNNLNVDDSVYVVLSAKPVIVKAGAR